MNSVASKPALIGVDWGTSSFRAYLIGSDGRVLDRVSTSEGIMQVGGQVLGQESYQFVDQVLRFVCNKATRAGCYITLDHYRGWLPATADILESENP